MIQKWNVALLRVRRLAHSLKRDTRSAVVHHPAGSPMSMTSPRTTLTCGHNAPLTLRPSAAPRPYFAITGATACFFGAICGTQGRLLRSQLPIGRISSNDISGKISAGKVAKVNFDPPLRTAHFPSSPTLKTTSDRSERLRKISSNFFAVSVIGAKPASAGIDVSTDTSVSISDPVSSALYPYK